VVKVVVVRLRTCENCPSFGGFQDGDGQEKGGSGGLWIATRDLARSPGHPFYERLNRPLEQYGFDGFVEQQCRSFYAERLGRPSVLRTYLRLLLIGYFEGIDSERGIAWRVADSLTLREFLGLSLSQAPPDHSTILELAADRTAVFRSDRPRQSVLSEQPLKDGPSLRLRNRVQSLDPPAGSGCTNLQSSAGSTAGHLRSETAP
jgi:hypothetical protein